MIRFACPNCGKSIQVKPELAGRKGKCPGCQSILVIPSASSEPNSPVAPAPPAAQPPARKRGPEPDFGSGFDFSSGPSSPSSSTSGGESSFGNYQPTNPYVATTHSQHPRTTNQNTGLPLGLGIGSIACGVSSAATCCCVGFLLIPLVIQLPLAAIGLGMGVAGIIYSKGQEGASRILPIIGTLISSIGTIFGIGILIAYMVGVPILQQHIEEQREKFQEQKIQRQIEEAELQMEIEEMRKRDQEKFKSFNETEENDPFAAPE